MKREKVAPSIPKEDIARVKGLGCLRDATTPDRFNVRIVTGCGRLTAQKLEALAEAARRFGNGDVALTARMCVEIQSVPFENIEPLREFLAPYGLESGGTGPKVRPIVACKGTTCQFGLIDTASLAMKLHKQLYQGYHDVKLPHKFKIAVGGCPNNCVKPDLNDIGIIGYSAPVADPEACKGCKKCQVEAACPMKAAHVADGKVVVDPQTCIRCGRCAGKCPFGAVTHPETGYRMFLGGRWGKEVARGIPLKKIFRTEEEVLEAVKTVIHLYRDQGLPGERLQQTIERLGFEYAEESVSNR